MNRSGAAFTDRQGLESSNNRNDNVEAQSEIIRHNTISDFFKIEKENDQLREQLYEVQSSFTHHDREYLDLTQEKYAAETEYE